MEKTIKERMEYIWNEEPCRLPLRLCCWRIIRDSQGYFYYLWLVNRGHNDAED